MIEADRADHGRAKLDHDLIVPITILERDDINPDRSDSHGSAPLF